MNLIILINVYLQHDGGGEQLCYSTYMELVPLLLLEFKMSHFMILTKTMSLYAKIAHLPQTITESRG